MSTAAVSLCLFVYLLVRVSSQVKNVELGRQNW